MRFGVLIALIVTAGFLYLIRNLFPPLLIAALLAYVLRPIVDLLHKRLKISHKAAVALVYGLFLTLSIATPVVLAPFVYQQVGEFSLDLDALESQIGDDLGGMLEQIGIDIELNTLLSDLNDSLDTLLLPERVFRLMGRTSANLAWALIALVTGYYLLLDWERLRDWIISLAPPDSQKEIRELYLEIATIWQSYLRGQLLLMLVIGVSSALASLAIGLPGALVIGLLAGLLDAVPSLGPAVAMGVATLIAWITGSTYLPLSPTLFAMLTLAVFGLIQLAENIYFRPRIMKYALKLHPALVIVGIVGSLTLAGILVTLIIIPLISSSMAVARFVYARVAPRPEPRRI